MAHLVHAGAHLWPAGAPDHRTTDGLVLGATLATLDAGSGYGLIEDGALGWRDGLIVYAGPRTGLPADPNSLSGTVIDLGGGLVTPGLVD